MPTAIAALAIALCWAGTPGAQPPGEPGAPGAPGAPVGSEAPAGRAIDESHPGFAAYRRYCAVCHGVFADGQGPAAPVLKTRPPDLSQLTAKYGDPLRATELAEAIDGRDMARSHGTSDMPVWGKRLYEHRRNTGQVEAERRGTLLQIIEYLDAIQRRG